MAQTAIRGKATGASARTTRAGTATIGDGTLARRLRAELAGEVLFDAFSRGRSSTDASIYQIEPIGVVVPREPEDVVRTIQIAAEEGVPVLPRGAGTSQCGQTVGAALVVDVSKHLNHVRDFDGSARRITVQPGLVLDRLNAFLEPHGLMFPVDVSTSSRAVRPGGQGAPSPFAAAGTSANRARVPSARSASMVATLARMVP